MVSQRFHDLKANSRLIALFTVAYVISYQLQRGVIFPLESQLGWEMTEKASMLYLPAGVLLLSFYYLRLWFIPVVLVGRTALSLQFWGQPLFVDALVQAAYLACWYPFLLRSFENAGWSVFGSADRPSFTVTGVAIFQVMATLGVSVFVTAQSLIIGQVNHDEAFQYVVHYLVGDVLGAMVVMYLFYLTVTAWFRLKTPDR